MEEIIGTIIIDGVTYLLKKIVDELGNMIWQAFTDDDGDRLPDDPDNPFQIWDHEPEDWNPFLPIDPDTPPVYETPPLQFIIIGPDGTMTIYDEEGNITAEDCDTAYSLWISENGALDKPFSNYSVSEALLLFIAAGSVVGLIFKIFKRRKL